MSIEFEADGRRATQTLFEASDIKVVKLVLGTTTILLMTPEHEEGSKSFNVCISPSLEQKGSASAPPPQPAGVAAADSPPPSDVSQEEPVAMVEMTKEEFMEKLRGWMMVLSSLFTSMTFQAGINPPRQFQPDVIMGAQNRVQLFYQERFFFLLNSFVFTYSLGLVMVMLFQSSLSAEILVGGRRGFFHRKKRGLLCGNIFFLLVVFGLGSTAHMNDMFIPLFGCSVLVCTMCYEKIRNKCKDWWKILRKVLCWQSYHLVTT